MLTRLSQDLGARLRLNVYTCLVIVALVAVMSAQTSLDSTQGSHELDIELFRNLWDSYIFPSLEMDFKKKLDSRHSDSEMLQPYGYLADHSTDQNANRQKRKNFMGMDNMDRMFASLNSKPRFMSMDSSFGNLQNLLLKAGRKRR
ncbi:uncharacterized protein LOC128233091 [Mya arenaria]|uniref:uncharacterized protein LOC128233091 n=1 Tax=Mya arenaria TaxID=6604 RepID=UPI0022E9064C|nr:uncharacterized protein LOC128233091 [Mya arenaria]